MIEFLLCLIFNNQNDQNIYRWEILDCNNPIHNW